MFRLYLIISLVSIPPHICLVFFFWIMGHGFADAAPADEMFKSGLREIYFMYLLPNIIVAIYSIAHKHKVIKQVFYALVAALIPFSVYVIEYFVLY